MFGKTLGSLFVAHENKKAHVEIHGKVLETVDNHFLSAEPYKLK